MMKLQSPENHMYPSKERDAKYGKLSHFSEI